MWVSLLGVYPVSWKAPIKQGAYVNAVGLADSYEDFLLLASRECQSMFLGIESFEDTELWSDRISNSNPESDVRDLVNDLSNETPFRLGVFYCYPIE